MLLMSVAPTGCTQDSMHTTCLECYSHWHGPAGCNSIERAAPRTSSVPRADGTTCTHNRAAAAAARLCG
eukprot:364181-Chlamydomonas_euryale.AAC.7